MLDGILCNIVTTQFQPQDKRPDRHVQMVIKIFPRVNQQTGPNIDYLFEFADKLAWMSECSSYHLEIEFRIESGSVRLDLTSNLTSNLHLLSAGSNWSWVETSKGVWNWGCRWSSGQLREVEELLDRCKRVAQGQRDTERSGKVRISAEKSAHHQGRHLHSRLTKEQACIFSKHK